jgi:hypothetical protein
VAPPHDSLNPARRFRAQAAGVLIGLSLLALVGGCGQSGRKAVYPVQGQVRAAGDQPAEGALVIFHPLGEAAGDSTKPLAYVKSDGSFHLTTYTQDDGAPEGEYAITIEWHSPNANPFAGKKETPDLLDGRYKDPAASKIHFTVEKKPANEVPTISVQ